MQNHFKLHGTVHLVWTIAVLVAIIICLLTSDLATNANIKDVLSFAVSLASLVLALVAIIQALLSGANLSEALASIRSAAGELDAPAREILAASKLLGTRSQSIEGHATELGRLALSLTRIEGDDSTSTKPKPISTPIDSNYLKKASRGGRICLYLLEKSYKAQKQFETFNIFSEKRMAFYANGFLTALNSLGLIGISSNKQGGNTITGLGQFSWLSEHIGEVRGTNNSEFIEEQFNEIDAFFGLESPAS